MKYINVFENCYRLYGRLKNIKDCYGFEYNFIF